MRQLFLILILVISYTSYTQDIRLFENEWSLSKLTIGDNQFLNPKDTEGLPVKLFFDDRSYGFIFHTSVCDTKEATLNFDSINPIFSIIATGTTLGGCSIFNDPSAIEHDYFDFYSHGSMLTYEITKNLDVLNLTITAANGDQAIYSNLVEIERIFEGSWLLQNLFINSENTLNPLNSRGTPVTTEFGSNSFESWICETINGKLNYISGSNIFSISEVFSTLGGCDIAPGINESDVFDIQRKFSDFFKDNGHYTYLIIEANNSDPKKLTIIDHNGNYVNLIMPLLSSKNFSDTFFSMYPNPVVDELSISSSMNLKNHKIEIFDLLGKLKISKIMSDSNSINVKNLSKGMYVVLITYDSGGYITKKFIK